MEYSSAALTGDYVGVESCIDLRNEEDFEAYVKDCERSYERRRQRRRSVGWRRAEVREFPPPITYLARTENQPSHMPWVMKRYYTTDGRLVIREEKVKHHEYFRAHRADGRLTLQLVPLDSYSYDNDDDNVDDIDVVNEEECTQESDEANENVDDKENVDKEEEKGEVVNEEVDAARVMVTSVSMVALCITEGVRSGGMLTSASSSCLTPTKGGKKCYEFNSLRSSSASSLFHLQVPAIRPVIS